MYIAGHRKGYLYGVKNLPHIKEDDLPKNMTKKQRDAYIKGYKEGHKLGYDWYKTYKNKTIKHKLN